jgi:hypothetical protein
MRLGTIVAFPGDAGKHSDRNDNDCSGRTFGVYSVGVSGIYINFVRCISCGRELEAYENGLAQPQRTTFADIMRYTPKESTPLL